MKLLAVITFFLIIVAQDDRAREANQAYERGDYEVAERIYRDILADDPGNTRVLFNLGNTLAKQQKHEESMEAFERYKRLTNNPGERSLADYNIGNLHSEKEQWDRAMEQYRKALRQNPMDDDARYNYELAQRMLHEQPPEQQQQEQQQGDGESDQQEQQQQDQQRQQQQDQDESDSQDQQQQDQQQGGQGDQQRNEQQRPQDMEGQVSPEEAERMLNALESKEKDLLKDHLKQQVPPSPAHAKDW